MIRFKTFLILFFIPGLFFLAQPVLAIGIGASPSFLNLELKVSRIKETQILAYNLSGEAAAFQVFPDELNDWFKIEPDNFRLEARETKEIKIKILAKEPGKRLVNLSVMSLPLDRRSFTVSQGLKIPFSLTIAPGEKSTLPASVSRFLNENILAIFFAISAIYFFSGFLGRYLKKRKGFLQGS